jgi:hypothetical protein
MNSSGSSSRSHLIDDSSRQNSLQTSRCTTPELDHQFDAPVRNICVVGAGYVGEFLLLLLLSAVLSAVLLSPRFQN